ncbi:MAG: TIGR02678 family protein [Sedimentibacter sp.]|uniref:TIGR02678 family protein n=1 Tax=Sedimentibacter sp. TaxID=1960295 RepID=UPI0029818395|nr:TIGR02678 family protein [Sedimentibacter sp.]MDW5299891.1 TIGR02678 family protein [Sedimentibacter sp.]
MRELIYLLENKWIIRQQDKELYYSVKDKLKDFKDFLKDKMGYQLIITSDFIKLEKIPGKAESWMGIEGFDSSIQYALLCIILMFLEDKEKGEQFVLSQLVDYIQANWTDKENPVDWTKYDLRKKFIKVLKYCADINIIRANDGSEIYFADSPEAEVLYENVGISKYLVNRFWDDISGFESYKDFENNEYNKFDEDKGVVRKNRVYRSLVMSPVVYKYDGYENDLIYIKNYRGMLENDMSKYIGAELHIHKNSAMVLLHSGSYKNVFPNNRNISDIVLQICYLIRQEYDEFFVSSNSNADSSPIDGKIDIPLEKFENIIKKCVNLYSDGWSKNFREMHIKRLIEEIIFEMKDFQMIAVDKINDRIIILPLAGKFVGKYPKDYKAGGDGNDKMENEQSGLY